MNSMNEIVDVVNVMWVDLKAEKKIFECFDLR